MKTKHTPGPWENSGGDNHSIDIVLDNETTISIDRQSRYSGQYVISREEMQANAALISAAPEMLEVLQEMLNHLETNDFDVCGTPEQMLVKARAVIAKAITI